MNWLELGGTAVALAMDAFAVAMCRGLEMKKLNVKHLLLIALMFGLFQALMPLIGWVVSVQFKKYIEPVDHWIAFALLVFIGVKMIAEAFKGDEDKKDSLNFKMLLLMSLATSIDALGRRHHFRCDGNECLDRLFGHRRGYFRHFCVRRISRKQGRK